MRLCTLVILDVAVAMCEVWNRKSLELPISGLCVNGIKDVR